LQAWEKVLQLILLQSKVFTPTISAMPADIRLLLSRAARTATIYFRERAAEQDLSVVQAQALIEVSEHPGISLGRLADSLSKDQASTSTLIDRMMTLGLVRRETDALDRRRGLLHVTAQAEPIVQHLKAARGEVNQIVNELLGPERTGQLSAILAELLTSLERSEVKASLQSAAD
jgi:DNA-binding MarR family transcriptional regulator